MRNLCAFIVVFLIAWLPAAARASIVIYNTGVDASGNPLGDQSLNDPHYTIVSEPNGVTSTTEIRRSSGGYPIPPWIGDDNVSAWIGPATDSTLAAINGNFTYRTSFTAPANVSLVTIAGQWAADDYGVDIQINGVSGGSQTAAISSWTNFTITEPVNAGASNTLDFINYNGGGPTGMRVEIENVTFTPEPAGIGALAGIAFLTLRRNRRLRDSTL